MRFILIALIHLMMITSCVNYVGIKEHSHLYDTNSLSIHHSYPLPVTTSMRGPCPEWWYRFHDPQLNQLIAVALTDSPNLQVAKSRVAKAAHIAEEAGSRLGPSIDFSGYIRRERFSGDGLTPPPFNGITATIGDVALNFNYELDFWGKNREALAARITEIQAAKADLAAANLIISAAVASAYFQLQYDIAQLQIAENIAQQQQSLLKISRLLTNRHIESAIPLSTVTTEEQAAHVNVAQAKQAVMLSRYQLATLMGKNPFTTEIVVGPFIYRRQSVSLPNQLPAHLLARRPDVIASRWRVEAACHEVNVAKARFFPDINLIGLYSYQSLGLNNLFKSLSRDIAGEAAIDLPIFDAGLRRANLKTNYAEYDIAVNQYNDAILTSLHQVADQLSTLQSIKTQLSAQTRLVKASQHRYALTQSRYQHGIDDYSVVLQRKITLLDQKRGLLQIQAQQFLATVAMIKALGGDYQI